MKTIMSVNHLSFYRAALTWYLEKEVKEMFLRHETLDLFDKCPEMDSVLFHKNTSLEFKSRGQVLAKQDSRNMRKWDKCLQPDQRPHLKDTELQRHVVNVLPCVMALQPKQKVYWEMIPSSGPSTMQNNYWNMDDTAADRFR